jgi:hypothetical protein
LKAISSRGKHGFISSIKKISTLAQIAQELHQGKDFNITRLTSLKSLCADPQAAGQFCLYLARLTQQKLQDKEKPDHLEEEIWLHCKHLINEAVPEMALDEWLNRQKSPSKVSRKKS